MFVSYVLLYAFVTSEPFLAASELDDAFWRDIYVRASSLDSWVETENNIAINRLLANIAPGGENAGGATAGTVLASPSRAHPNYYYQCKRLSLSGSVKYIGAEVI